MLAFLGTPFCTEKYIAVSFLRFCKPSVPPHPVATSQPDIVQYRIKGSYMFFHALTFAGNRGSCLNMRPLDRMFKLLPRDPANIIALKQTWLIVIRAFLHSCILYDSLKNPIEDARKIMKNHPLMPFYFSQFLTSFRAKCNDVDVYKNQDNMLIPGQPCIVVWHYVKHLVRPVPSWGCLSKNHVQTARESHDLNMILVVTAFSGFDNGFKQLWA